MFKCGGYYNEEMYTMLRQSRDAVRGVKSVLLQLVIGGENSTSKLPKASGASDRIHHCSS
jgi:hypothetical protein